MENKWAVYGWFGQAWDIGIVACNFNKGVYIKETEEQKTHLDYWDLKRIKRFDTSSEAIDYFFNHQGLAESPDSIEDITKRLTMNFPTAMKQEAVQSLHDILVAHYDTLSQSLPKCTTEKVDLCKGCLRQEKTC
jgi:hypothetical protein